MKGPLVHLMGFLKCLFSKWGQLNVPVSAKNAQEISRCPENRVRHPGIQSEKAAVTWPAPQRGVQGSSGVKSGEKQYSGPTVSTQAGL